MIADQPTTPHHSRCDALKLTNTFVPVCLAPGGHVMPSFSGTLKKNTHEHNQMRTRLVGEKDFGVKKCVSGQKGCVDVL
jgi:hypothetical protein